MAGNARWVLPGEPVGGLEEYIAGEGVYVDEESGVLRSKHYGVLTVDPSTRVAHVKPVREPHVPRAGSSVVGVVSHVRHDLAVVEIYGQVSLTPTPRWTGEYSGIFSGGLPIDQVSVEYVRDMSESYRVGDVVLVKVLNSNSPYHLSSRQPQYGVLYARCSNCGSIMAAGGEKSVKCSVCGRVEARKVSILAGSNVLQLRIRRLLSLNKF